MRPFRHRDPGIAGAALARDDVIVQVILDGHHIAEETARVVWRAASDDVALVSDAIAAAGVGDGSYRLGDVDVEVRDGVARREDGVLAGSALAFDRGRTQVARTRRPPRRCSRRGDRGAGPRRPPARSRLASPRRGRGYRRARRRAGYPHRLRRRRGFRESLVAEIFSSG